MMNLDPPLSTASASKNISCLSVYDLLEKQCREHEFNYINNFFILYSILKYRNWVPCYECG